MNNEKIVSEAQETPPKKVRHIWEKNTESGKWIRKCQLVESKPDFSENRQAYHTFLFETLFAPKSLPQPSKG